MQPTPGSWPPLSGLLVQRDGEAGTGLLWRQIDVHGFCKMERPRSHDERAGEIDRRTRWILRALAQLGTGGPVQALAQLGTGGPVQAHSLHARRHGPNARSRRMPAGGDRERGCRGRRAGGQVRRINSRSSPRRRRAGCQLGGSGARRELEAWEQGLEEGPMGSPVGPGLPGIWSKFF